MKKELVAALDQGTTNTKFILFKNPTEIYIMNTCNIQIITPSTGWKEQNPFEILNSVNTTIDNTIKSMDNMKYTISALGITNQRETVILWDKHTGIPFYNAILWSDIRTKKICDRYTNQYHKFNFQNKCGLPISSYFSVFKIIWLMENIKSVKKAMNEKRCLFGTIDSWLIWNLTGGKNQGIHITDITNSSRTLLFNIKTGTWDNELCKIFNIPIDILPKICVNSKKIAKINQGKLSGIYIYGCIGDQQAALIGHQCLNKGNIKCTFGTGSFILHNSGEKFIIPKKKGLIYTIGYKLHEDSKIVYAIEGSIAYAGSLIKWLIDNLLILGKEKELELIIKEKNEIKENGVIFIPTFSGVLAPYWNEKTTGSIYGLTFETDRTHIIIAAIESICFQIKDLLDIMKEETNKKIDKLFIDGGMSYNLEFSKMLANVLEIDIYIPRIKEITALGAAICAGLGSGVWDAHNIKNNNFYEEIIKPSKFKDVKDFYRDRYQNWKRIFDFNLRMKL